MPGFPAETVSPLFRRNIDWPGIARLPLDLCRTMGSGARYASRVIRTIGISNDTGVVHGSGMPEEEDTPRRVEIQLPEAIRPGVWANFANVVASPFEFTLDFARMDFAPGEGVTGGIVVARVSMSPLFIRQLIDALESNWQQYAERAMPPEVRQSDVHGEGSPE